jgi:hypothetical protein
MEANRLRWYTYTGTSRTTVREEYGRIRRLAQVRKPEGTILQLGSRRIAEQSRAQP